MGIEGSNILGEMFGTGRGERCVELVDVAVA